MTETGMKKADIQGSRGRIFQRGNGKNKNCETTILIHSKDRHEIREVGRGLRGHVLGYTQQKTHSVRV